MLLYQKALWNICLPLLSFGNSEGLNHTLLQVFPHVCLYALCKCGYSYNFVAESVKSRVFLFSIKPHSTLVSIQSSGLALTGGSSFEWGFYCIYFTIPCITQESWHTFPEHVNTAVEGVEREVCELSMWEGAFQAPCLGAAMGLGWGTYSAPLLQAPVRCRDTGTPGYWKDTACHDGWKDCGWDRLVGPHGVELVL